VHFLLAEVFIKQDKVEEARTSAKRLEIVKQRGEYLAEDIHKRWKQWRANKDRQTKDTRSRQ